MAVYTQLTKEQESTIEYLFNRAKSIKKRMKNDDLVVEESYDALKQELLDIQKQINDVIAARDKYEFHIKLAAAHLEEAEKLKKEYGF